jgi:hypothetical protein
VSDTPNLDRLREIVVRLHSLVNDPHPGLATWCGALAAAMDDLVAFRTKEPSNG